MIPVAEARARILSAFAALPAETVPLPAGLGRILAEPVAARLTQPPLDVSAMDGWAVRAADVATVPATLRRIGEVPAGGRFEGTVGPGQCVRIFTGAPLPDGADAVVLQEDTDADSDRVTVREGVAAGRHVRKAGLDFRASDVLLQPGRRLTARDIGIAASANHPWLRVRRRPRVAVLATGDEIVLPGEALGPSQIVSSNSHALAALIRSCGGEPVDLGIARDNAESLATLAAGAHGADLVVTTGGASVGEHDLIRSVLGERGLALDFWKIAMRPGKPLIFGRLGDTPLLGLPGNPVSTMVCGWLFLRPAVWALQGAETSENRVTAVLGRDLPANDRREDYLRARIERTDSGYVATPFPAQDSSMLSLLAAADGLVIRSPHAPAAARGESVEAVLFGDGI
ncbi:gephyrin-like molybdotransferase Glp [Inquilinus sp. YAF38]|uniref:molybdopterin molybdotransferase MoeA n=1 Tax=Inquilinus sp. YAF38 TaxID=3233084 RepID=UPI003F8F45F0